MKLGMLALIVLSGAAAAQGASSTLRAELFEDVTERAGVERTGASYGLALGDYDGDGRPDLLLGNHKHGISLHRNRGDGTFEDVTARVFVEREALSEDHHGVGFADLENDGDLDLLVATGGGSGTGVGANKVFLQHLGEFRERAVELGLDHPLGRGRTLRTIDLGLDGLPDVLCVATARPDRRAATGVFLRRPDELAFDDVSARHVIPGGGHFYAQQLRVAGRGDLVFVRDWAPRVYALDDIGGEDLARVLGLSRLHSLHDSVFADFDGDGDLDLFGAGWSRHSEVHRAAAAVVEFTLVSSGEPAALRLRQQDRAGKVGLRLYGNFGREDVFVGREGQHPAVDECAYRRIELDLSAFDPRVHGTFEDAVDRMHVRVSWESDTWTVELHSKVWTEIRGVALSSTGRLVPDIEAAESEADGETLLWFDGQKFEPATARAGFVPQREAVAAAAGDFDNDMDVDLYVVRSTTITNTPNDFYENLGDGRFHRHVGGAGAGGTLLGHGDAVAAADLDGDGFLDLCVTNGSGGRPFEDDGPVQVFRNLGNDNHWLALDLVGRHATRDALGAVVWVTAGGITQMRHQDNGLHGYAQDHARLHFGLGPHAQVERVVVRWPDGIEQELTGLAADRVHRIEEPR